MQDELIKSLQFHAPKVGSPGWQANHDGGIETPQILRCTPANEAGARQRVSVFIEGPMGGHRMEPWNQIRLTGVLPPRMAGVNGIFNDYHYVEYPDGFDELKGKRLEDGWYGVEWRVELGRGYRSRRRRHISNCRRHADRLSRISHSEVASISPSKRTTLLRASDSSSACR